MSTSGEIAFETWHHALGLTGSWEEAHPDGKAAWEAAAGAVIALGDAKAPALEAPVPDPWAHRSAGMRCASCMWFVAKSESQLGRCRRHAPTMAGYPVVFPDDWCGDHKLDETKL